MIALDLATARTARYFDALYLALDASPTHARIGREALGDAFVGQLGWVDEGELLRIAEVAGMARGRLSIELCCGSGGLSQWFATRTGARVVGIDCSSAGLRLGARTARDAHAGVSFVQADLRRLPLGDGRADSIICIDGFGSDFSGLAVASRRALRPEGALVLLLSLPAGEAPDTAEQLRQAGFEDVFAEDRSGSARALMARWLDACRRHAPRHVEEIGERYHRALLEETERVMNAYATGELERVLLVARGATAAGGRA